MVLISLILILKKLWQEDRHELEASLGYSETPASEEEGLENVVVALRYSIHHSAP